MRLCFQGADEHVARAEFDELERAGSERRSLIGRGHAVSERREGGAEESVDKQEIFREDLKRWIFR